MKDYYYILGLDPACSDDEIKTAFRRLSFKYHPDQNNQDRYFEPLLNSVDEAYKELSKNRRNYNDRLKAYQAARASQSNYQKPQPQQEYRYKNPKETARENAEKARKEREEWIKNHPPPKPFSDPIFKNKN